MGALTIVKQSTVEQQKNAPFKVIDGTKKYNLDGSIKRTHPNKVAGKSSEVFAFRTNEEIKAMIDVFDKHIADAPDENKEQIACRNKLLFLIGINIGIRASDLRTLKWSFFLEDNEGKREFKTHYQFQPKKQRNSHKFVTLKFNEAVKKFVNDFVEEHPVDDLDTYIFKSRKSTGRMKINDKDVADSKGYMPIAESSIGRIMKETAKEAGIKQNICSHSLRKTWGYHAWHQAEDKEDMLIRLSAAFAHSSTKTTRKYIGIMQDEIDEIYDNVCLGMI